MHDTLYFLDWLHEEIQKQGEFTEKGAWPTRDIIRVNLEGNHALFPRDRNPRWSFNRQFAIARERHWAAEDRCSKQCHAKHLMLTKAGSAVLELMNREGCEWSSELRFVKEAA